MDRFTVSCALLVASCLNPTLAAQVEELNPDGSQVIEPQPAAEPPTVSAPGRLGLAGPDPTAASPDSTSLRFSTGIAYQPGTDIDGGGEFSQTRFSLLFGGRHTFNEQFTLDAGAGYEFDSYDFSGRNQLDSSDPWGDVHAIRVRVNLSYALNERWSVFGGPIVTWAGEDGADFGEAVTGGGTIGTLYRRDASFYIGSGMLIITQLEENVAFFPVIRFGWKFAEQWELRSGNFDLGSSGGGGLELAWDFLKDWEIALGGQYQTRRFRLDKGGPASEGVGEERAVPVYFRLSATPVTGLQISGYAGVTAYGQLRLDDSNGNRVTRREFDPAAILGLTLSYRF